MRRLNTWLSLILAAMLLIASPASAEVLHTRQDVRSAYAALGRAPSSTPYAQEPSILFPYEPGSLTEEALEDAIAYMNFLRSLAYLDAPVELDEDLNQICQHGAVLLASLDRVDHQPERPEDMPAGFYRIASYATASSSLAGLTWMKGDILRSALEYFARDDGQQNLPVLGHRRWLLNPTMGKTGFGLANADSGMTYVAMFAHDLSGEAPSWSEICWPSAGAFPAELMRTELAWSVTLNAQIYDLAASSPRVYMKETVSGAEFSFEYPAGAYENGYFSINTDAYGSGPCLIFLPNLPGAGLEEYQQNQRWQVCVSGLKDIEGREAEIRYETEMIALHAIDPASVEISLREAALAPGETLRLAAEVIPAWADDVSVAWRSSDAQVARVDADGVVTALAPGACEIIASSANGREDICRLTVGE